MSRVNSINVKNIDEIRWTISNQHLTIQVVNKSQRAAGVRPINHMNDPVSKTMDLLELCAEDIDKGVKKENTIDANFEMMRYCCKFYRKGEYFECDVNREMPKYKCEPKTCPMIKKEDKE